jgi:NAD(P)H-dependent FMN reductase
MGKPDALKLLILTGSTRIGRVGPRVAKWCSAQLEERGHQVDVFDPLEDESFPSTLRRPHFFYPKDKAPAVLDELAEKIKDADGFVMLSPEYNHAPSPALLNTLNHFGSSLFAWKPSAIVCYSAGQWGGTRAAIGLRPVLSELGCLPVSAMINIPAAQQVFDEKGGVVGDSDVEDRWQRYGDRCWSQLEWWGAACKRQRELGDPNQISPPLKSDPSQRNAP